MEAHPDRQRECSRKEAPSGGGRRLEDAWPVQGPQGVSPEGSAAD